MTTKTWFTTPYGVGATIAGRRISIRHITFGRGARKPDMWWLYIDGNRYSPTGDYDDAVNFDSLRAAQLFALSLVRTAATYPVTRSDGRIVRVTVPPSNND